MIARESYAQATVEMAVVLPILLVLALIAYNLMMFICATARFDRIAPDIVVAYGVAPSGSAIGSEAGQAVQGSNAAGRIRQELEQSMGSYGVTVTVEVESAGHVAEGGLLSLVAPLKTYRCAMEYTPWPHALSIAGVELDSPLHLRHERAVTVDAWRSGVVV